MKTVLTLLFFALSPLLINASDWVPYVSGGITFAVNKDLAKAHVAGYDSFVSSSDFQPVYAEGDVVIPSYIIYNGVKCEVTSIDYRAFLGNITSITIPPTLKYISNEAFSWDREEGTGIQSVFIEDLAAWCDIYGNADEIPDGPLPGAKLYLNRKLVKNLSIPEDVNNFGCAFEGCTSLLTIQMHEGINSISEYAFRNCIYLNSTNIPESITAIGEYSFAGCIRLKDIIIPEGVTFINWGTFYGCNQLNMVDLGSGVTEISPEAFQGCNHLTDLYCRAQQPPIATYDMETDDTFIKTHYSKTTLHVPASAVNAYRSTLPWSRFKHIVAIEEATGIKQLDTTIGIATYHTVSGQPISHPTKGVYIEKSGNHIKKVIIH